MRCTWNNNMRWRKETLLERPPPPTVNFTRSSNIYALEVPSKSKLGSLLQVWLVYVTWALLEGSHIVYALRSLCENVECSKSLSFFAKELPGCNGTPTPMAHAERCQNHTLHKPSEKISCY
jgi:hypothetical protein